MDSQSEKDLVVVKVGTNVLTKSGEASERLDESAFENIGGEVRRLSREGTGVVLVSSGAITAGVLDEEKEREHIQETTELQRYAARGWDRVVQKWKSAIGDERVSAALLTKRELHKASTRDQALGVISCALAHDDVFVVNENDTISDDEIRFGDNDTLAAALAAECASAGLFRSVRLILLTNTNGLYADPNDESTLIRTVNKIETIEEYAGSAENGHSRGGMKTKIEAAKTAKNSGVETCIASGRTPEVITRALQKQVGTAFEA